MSKDLIFITFNKSCEFFSLFFFFNFILILSKIIFIKNITKMFPGQKILSFAVISNWHAYRYQKKNHTNSLQIDIWTNRRVTYWYVVFNTSLDVSGAEINKGLSENQCKGIKNDNSLTVKKSWWKVSRVYVFSGISERCKNRRMQNDIAFKSYDQVK